MTVRRGLPGKAAVLGGAVALCCALLGAGAPAASAKPGDYGTVSGQGPDASPACDRSLAGPGPATTTTVPQVDPDVNVPVSASTYNLHSSGGSASAIDAGGRVYVAELDRVRGPGGIAAGTHGTAKDRTSGLARNVPLGHVTALAIDASGASLYLVEQVDDSKTLSQVLWRVSDPAGSAPTIAQIGPIPGSGQVETMAADSRGDVFVAARDGVRRISGAGESTSVAPGVKATGLAVDAAGTVLFVAEGQTNTVSQIDLGTAGTAKVVAGIRSGTGDYSGDGGPATAARLSSPASLAVDPLAKQLFISDQNSATPGTTRVRRVNLASTAIDTVLGSGAAGEAGRLTVDGGALGVDVNGFLYVSDLNNCRILRVEVPAAPLLNAATQNPPPPANNTTNTPDKGAGTGDPKPNADPGTAANPAGQQTVPTPQADPGSAGVTAGGQSPANQAPAQALDPGGAGAQAGLGSQSGVGPTPAASPFGNAGLIPGPAHFPGPSLFPGLTHVPGPSAIPGLSSAPGPLPTLTPGPEGAGAGAGAGAGTTTPAGPAAAPGPVPGAAAPPPPAPQPAANVGLGAVPDSGAKGSPRYAMVSNDDDSGMAAAAMLVGGALITLLFCLMLAAPGAAPKPRPRPRGAY